MDSREAKEAWGRWGLHDGRAALGMVGHPCANAAEPILVASHERAITDLALHFLRAGIRPTQGSARTRSTDGSARSEAG